ncbi:bifunctional DedA family/phosphatase PAP2 family protein [Thiobacillus sp.]|uniref:bifunctional DedA family/phosphatase PAP2 family protein n=1 Tax=Thiobacillus sp. TaxID=924 RepID=UPI0011D6BE1E|nr:bifunctional DedA family/phosphatase PAP2 family protein [Thiobacillus sp.]TXH74453.1 MAG: phosphatase PAP2 family protein [Thiobacillus sp.]
MHDIEIQSFLSWVAQHPHWALTGVFLVALGESLAVVGLVVPGAAMMVAAGALVALGVIGFWPTLLAAVAGAITGDGISYWFGHHYRDRLRSAWPFRSHAEWLSHGEHFFRRHGARSVFFGRFVGPVRPIIPVVAGMLGMRPAAFYAMNVLSALAWAPAHLLPGMAFGASLALAGMVAARLAMLLVLLVASTWFLLWLVRWSSRALSPQAHQVAQRVLTWGAGHPRLNRLFGGVLDPPRPEARALLLIGALLIGSTWLFLGVLEDVVTGDPLVRADQSLYQLMQGLRTPWGDKLMVFVTELGDGVVIALVAVTVWAWLMWRKRWRAAKYWAAAIGFGQVASTMIKLVLQRPRPLADLYDGLSTYAFPSGHAAMSMVAYGFLAVLIAGQLARPRRWIVYAVAALLISGIAASRLYLGAHWLSDVIGGLSLGFAWVCLLAIAYYRRPVSSPPPRSFPGVVLIAFALAGGWHVTTHYSTDVQRYAPRQVIQHLDAAMWWQTDWRRLPVYRQDLEGEFEQPLNVQWAGRLGDLQRILKVQGWRNPVSLDVRTALRWLAPATTLEELPLLPLVHDGRHEVLRMIFPLPAGREGQRELVLRLWNSGVVLDSDENPIWVGSASFQRPGHFALLTVPVEDRRYEEALSILARSPKTTGSQFAQRARNENEIRTAWTGDVLLMRNP